VDELLVMSTGLQGHLILGGSTHESDKLNQEATAKHKTEQ
jgi:hypothetical protein